MFTYVSHTNQLNIGKFASPMDPMKIVELSHDWSSVVSNDGDRCPQDLKLWWVPFQMANSNGL